MICLLHVAICDDEETFVQHLNALLTRYAQETGIALKISTYRDGADLVDPYDASLDLIFLDIQMPELNGLEFSKMVDSRTRIVFTTAFGQYAIDGYRVNALDYLLKALAGEYEMKMQVSVLSVAISIALTVGMSLLVSLMVSRKNKKIDMVEALKGAE